MKKEQKSKTLKEICKRQILCDYSVLDWLVFDLCVDFING